MLGGASVESKDELVKVMVQLMPRHPSLVGAKEPSLQQRYDTMNSWQHADTCSLGLMVQHCESMTVSQLLDSVVSPGAIRAHPASESDVVANKSLKDHMGRLLDAPNPDSPHSFAPGLDSYDHEGFLGMAVLVTVTADQSFIYLNDTLESLPGGTDHGSAQLVHQCPGGLVASQAECPLESQGTHPTLLVRRPPDGAEPDPQRQFAAIENGAREQRDVFAALAALQEAPLSGPSLPMATTTAFETFRPTELEEVIATAFFRAKPMLEFEDSSWKSMAHQGIL